MVLITNNNNQHFFILKTKLKWLHVFIRKTSFKYDFWMAFMGKLQLWGQLLNNYNGFFGTFMVQMIHLDVIDVISMVEITKMFHLGYLQSKVFTFLDDVTSTYWLFMTSHAWLQDGQNDFSLSFIQYLRILKILKLFPLLLWGLEYFKIFLDTIL